MSVRIVGSGNSWWVGGQGFMMQVPALRAIITAVLLAVSVLPAQSLDDGPDCFLASLRACIFGDDGPTALIALMVFAGSTHEAARARGTAHYLEHLLLSGRDKQEREGSAEHNGGADIDAYANGFTTQYVTVYHWTVPQGRAGEALRRALGVLEARQSFPNDLVEQERTIVTREWELRRLDEGNRLAADARTRLYRGLPLADPVIGRAPDVAALDAAGALAFKEAHYQPENAMLIVSGLTRADIEAAVGPARAPRFDLPKRPPFQLPDDDRSMDELVRVDDGAGAASRSVRTLLSHPTGPADRAAIGLIDRFFASRLPGSPYAPLVRERQAVSDIDADLYVAGSGLVSLDVWTTLRPGVDPGALDGETAALWRYVGALSDGLPEHTVARLAKRAERDLRTARKRPDRAAWSLIHWVRHGGTVEQWRAYPDTVAGITADDVNALLKQLPQPKRQVVSDLLPSSKE